MKRDREICLFCGAKIPVESICFKCGQPTPHMSAKDRILWELGQWKTTRSGGTDDAGRAPATTLVAERPPAPVIGTIPPARKSTDNNHISRNGNGHAASASAASTAPAPEVPRQRPVGGTKRTLSVYRSAAAAPVAPATKPVPVTPQTVASVATAPSPAPAPVARPVETTKVDHTPVTASVQSPPQTPIAPARRDRKKPKAAVSAPAPVRAPRPEKAERVRAPKPARAPKPEKPKRQREPKAARAPKAPRETRSFKLREGEQITLQINGWSRFRPATLAVTNHRVILRRWLGKVRWIPLQHVDKTAVRWRGAWAIVLVGSVEILALQKSGRRQIDMFHAMVDSEIGAAQSGARRHDPDLVQEWCDMATEVWDSHFGKIRIAMRRHPVTTLFLLGGLAGLVRFALG